MAVPRAPLVLTLLAFAAAASVGAAPAPPRQAVATDHAVATEVARRILLEGGSAADAAAAAMLALGVASPVSSGFGGGGFATYYRASDRSVTFLDFREQAPAAATSTMFVDAERAHPGSRASQIGGLSVGVPGEPAGIAELVRRFGRFDLRRVTAPAIRLATRGVAPSPTATSAASAEMLRAFGADTALRGWLRGGRLRSRLAQPALAAVLRAYGRSGPEAVYRGPLAARIAADVRARGGLLTTEDLAAYRVRERAPLRERHFGFDWVTAPPPSAGGMTLLASLDFAERAGLTATSDEVAFAHTLAEAWKGPYLDRQAAFGDPDFIELPMADLTSPERRAERAARFDPNRAQPASRYAMPLGGGSARTPDGGGTTHLCVVDAEGNVASVTTTVNLSFGARMTAGGILMNDQMDDFASDVGVANAFGLVGGERNLPGPGRRPVSSMLPTVVFDRSGAPVLCIGGAGGSRIPTATTQVALRILLRGETVTAALAAPRVHHQAVPDSLATEERVPASPELLAALAARGHVLTTRDFVAVVQAIRIEAGVPTAGADPRKGGLGIAF